MAVMMNLFSAIFIVSDKVSGNRGYNRDGKYKNTAAWEKIWNNNPAGLIDWKNDIADDRLDKLDGRLGDLEESYDPSVNQLIGTNSATINKMDPFSKLKSAITEWVIFFSLLFKKYYVTD